MTATRFPWVPVAPADLPDETRRRLKQHGWRFGHLTARALGGSRLAVEALLLDTNAGCGVILSAEMPEGACEYPSVTQKAPAAHWAERAVCDMFGLRAAGHPRWKSLLLHDNVWPREFTPLHPVCDTQPAPVRDPYAFMKVQGEGIHEIPVGPIHAGVIEPGHFRFSCAGEIVTNLEIRLGYQHRGIERCLQETPWRKARFLAESVSTDTAIGNALAHATAIEEIAGVPAPPRAQALRTVALELERLANHVGDLGGLSGDIGFSPGASIYAPLRGTVLGLCETLTGHRLQRWFVAPGGVTRDLAEPARARLLAAFAPLARRIREAIPLLLENPAALDRMEGVGRLSPALAKDFGLVGPAGRASGNRYDARTCFAHAAYPGLPIDPAHCGTGDVLARARVRAAEIETSLILIQTLLDDLPNSPVAVEMPDALPPNAVGVGIVEAWRGELIHWVTTDGDGSISRYSVKDPSFNNWTGLAIAVRGNLVADFPLCNKSFNLSYSGNDG